MKANKIINATSRKHEAELRSSIAEILRNRGMSNSEIAKVLGVTYHTVYSYIGAQPTRNFGGCYKRPKNQATQKKIKKENPVSLEKAKVDPKKKNLSREARLDLLIDTMQELIYTLKGGEEPSLKMLP